jgi:hypothetical protein
LQPLRQDGRLYMKLCSQLAPPNGLDRRQMKRRELPPAPVLRSNLGQRLPRPVCLLLLVSACQISGRCITHFGNRVYDAL